MDFKDAEYVKKKKQLAESFFVIDTWVEKSVSCKRKRLVVLVTRIETADYKYYPLESRILVIKKSEIP